MAQASQSQMSRYYPAVWSIAGIGVAYAIYTLYTAQRPTTTSLHRSNAVHRPRRQNRPVNHRSVAWAEPTAEAPLGAILIGQENHEVTLNLATMRITDMGPITGELQSFVLDMLLTSMCSAHRSSDIWTAGERFGFAELLSAIADRDGGRFRTAAAEIPRIMHLDTIGRGEVEQAVNAILTSPDWLAGADSDSEPRDPAETEDLLDQDQREPSQGLRGLLYYIAEEDAKRKAYEHRGITCEGCGAFPIQGIRYHCLNCPDFDLCASCEAHTRHPKTHVFAKVKIPLPVLSQPRKEYRLWYPGDPRKIHPSLDLALKKRLSSEYQFEEPQIEAFFDQFTVIANVPWLDDESLPVDAAIDRRAFDKALTSDRWPKGLVTNAMFDRVWAFYDTARDGVIDFEEFVSGLAYLRGPKRYASLRRCVQGYDMDGDGYVDRTDFLRLLRAKYAIQKQLVSDSIDSQAADQTLSGLETLRTSLPISSIFSQEEIPVGETRRPRGKVPDVFGDMQPLPGTNTVLADDAPFTRSKLPSAQERLRLHLSRFEEMIYSTGHVDRAESAAQVDGVADPSNNDPHEPLGQVLDVPQLFPDHEYETEEPFIQDVLWHITEEGFNSLLNPLFKERESEDDMVVSTRGERKKWRVEINAEADEQRRFREQLIAAASDPLMATATPSLPDPTATSTEDLAEGSGSAKFGLVPTDWETLSRREADISDAALDELLNASGYGMRDASDNGSESTVATEISKDIGCDPTLPQHKPNATTSRTAHQPVSTSVKSDIAAPESSERPSKRELQYLLRMDELERGLQERGGRGRLSIDEVEHITVTQSTQALRGVIKSWLEHASF